MARYIDADKLIEKYENAMAEDWNKKTSPLSWSDAYDCVIADIDEMPTADVVPKSEIAKIFEEIERHSEDVGFSSFMERREFTAWIAELKKKYTEEK